MSNLQDAVDIARIVEPVAAKHGAHVALTGGCLYKDGERKDIDLFFFSHRGGPGINRDGLLAELETVGFTLGEKRGSVRKSTFFRVDIGMHSCDLFFRELPPEFERPGLRESSKSSAGVELDTDTALLF